MINIIIVAHRDYGQTYVANVIPILIGALVYYSAAIVANVVLFINILTSAELGGAYVTQVICVQINANCNVKVTKIAQMIAIFILALCCNLATVITKMVLVHVVAAACARLAHVAYMISVFINGTGGFFAAADIADVIRVLIRAGAYRTLTYVTKVVTVIINAIAIARIVVTSGQRECKHHNAEKHRIFYHAVRPSF